MQPRHRCGRASTRSRTSNESLSPAIPSADGSCPMSSADEASPDPSRSPPVRLHSFQVQTEVLRVAGTESVLVVVPRFVPVKSAGEDTVHEDDPVRDGNHRNGCLSRNRKGYSLVFRFETCTIQKCVFLSKHVYVCVCLYGEHRIRLRATHYRRTYVLSPILDFLENDLRHTFLV